MSGRAKVILFGIDGGTAAVLDPLMRAGRLPNLAALAARGCRATLESTVPWHSAAAWTTAVTGVQPGRHGIFNFFEMKRDLRNLPLGSGDARAEKLWGAMNRHGLSAGVVNVPMTYPAEPVRGFMISGLPNPAASIHPPERRQTAAGIGSFLDETAELRDGYFINPRREPEARIRMDLDRAAAAESLADLAPDFLMFVCSATDELQHRMWHSWDVSHPANPRCDLSWEPQAIPRAYEAADSILAKLIRVFGGPETTVIVMSDHGFGPAKKIVFPNRLLAEWGFLSPSVATPGALSADPNYAPSKIGFDPRRTRAFMGPALVGPFAEIFINAAGRFDGGIVAPGEEFERVRDEIAARFLDWRDPLSGFKPVVAAHKRESLYDGPYAAAAPDLLIEFADCRTMAEASEYPAIIDAVPWHIPTKAQTGTHIRDGILIAAGPGISNCADAGRLSIADIAPAVLYAAGLPVPEGLDGRLPERIFTPERLAAQPVRSEAPLSADSAAGSQTDPEDTAHMTRILEGLGYFA